MNKLKCILAESYMITENETVYGITVLLKSNDWQKSDKVLTDYLSLLYDIKQMIGGQFVAENGRNQTAKVFFQSIDGVNLSI